MIEKQLPYPLVVTVERAVRPVPARTARKRQMREELLAHLSGIYEQELTRTSDPAAALAAASRRFGDPSELARELAAGLPRGERTNYLLERLFGWRAPETAARYLARLAMVLFAICAILVGLSAGAMLATAGWDRSAWAALRPALALLLFLPLGQFVLGLLYFRMRDAMWGAFGQPRSIARMALYAALMAAAVMLVGTGFVALASGSGARAVDALATIAAASVAAAVGYLALAYRRGRTEISDTLWACLDLESPVSPGGPPPSGGTHLESA